MILWISSLFFVHTIFFIRILSAHLSNLPKSSSLVSIGPGLASHFKVISTNLEAYCCTWVLTVTCVFHSDPIMHCIICSFISPIKRVKVSQKGICKSTFEVGWIRSCLTINYEFISFGRLQRSPFFICINILLEHLRGLATHQFCQIGEAVLKCLGSFHSIPQFASHVLAE